jgi:O-antigen ligase
MAWPRLRFGPRALRFMLWRRRVDPWILTAALALFGLNFGVEVLLLALFVTLGLYLAILRPRSLARIDRVYGWPALALALGALGIGLWQGEFLTNLRWIALPTHYLALGIALFAGLVLVRDPLRQVVLGARIGTVLALVWALMEFGGLVLGLWTLDPAADFGWRVSLGSNPVRAAYTLALMGVIARLPVRDAPRLLPNSPVWFYLSAVPVLLTGTRSALPPYLLAAAFDLSVWAPMRAMLPHMRRLVAAVAAGSLALAALAFITVQTGVVGGALSTGALVETHLDRGGGWDARVMMWARAADLINAHPLLGTGAVQSLRAIWSLPPDALPGAAPFLHVHNILLDELRLRGMAGVFLHLVFFILVLGKIWRLGTPDFRANLSLYVLFLLSFGTLQSPLMHDRVVALTTIYLVVLLLDLRRRLGPAVIWRLG